MQLSDPLHRRCKKSPSASNAFVPFTWERLECVYFRTFGSSTISVLVASIVAKLLHASSATNPQSAKTSLQQVPLEIKVRGASIKSTVYELFDFTSQDTQQASRSLATFPSTFNSRCSNVPGSPSHSKSKKKSSSIEAKAKYISNLTFL
jgi:hypothetical protein